MKKLPTKKLRVVLGACVVLAAFSWLVWTLWDSADDLYSAAENLSPYRILSGALTASMMLYVSAYVFFLLLRNVAKTTLSIRDILSPYLTALVIRYIPGKVWGFAYQIHKMSKFAKSSDIAETSILQYVLTNTSSVAVLCGIFIYRLFGTPIALASFAILTMVLYVLIRYSCITRSFNLVLSVLPRHTTYSIDREMDTTQSVRLILSLYLEWVFYLASWSILLSTEFHAANIITIAGIYAASWIVGSLVLVAPDGWGVRESSFVGIGALLGYDAAHLFVYGLTARFMFILADVLAMTTSLLIGNGKGA